MGIPFNNAPQGYEHTGRAYRFLLYPNGTGTPTVQGGGVASVARSDTGQYLVTLQNAHYKMTGAKFQYLCAANNVDMYAQGGTVGNLGTGSSVTAYVKLKTGGTNTDVAAGATEYIACELVFDDSAVVLG